MICVGSTLLYQRICDHVLEQIRSGELAPGARVASEMELAEQFQVSRITSKRALEVLRRSGVIERIRGKGSFVVQDLPDLGQLGFAESEEASDSSPAPITVALVMPDASEAYGLQLLYAVEERCAEAGVQMLLRRTLGQQSVEEEVVEALTSGGRVDGLIVFPVHGEFYNASLLRAVVDGFPLVLVDRYLSGLPVCAVHTDNVAAARALTERVLEAGHRNVAFVSTSPRNTSSIEERLTGFRAACVDSQLTPNQYHELTDLSSTLPGAFSPAAVEADAARIVAFASAHPEVTAFVVCEYNLARVVAKALPETLIACFDSPGDPINGPQFLHVSQDQREMGRQALDLLLAQIHSEPVPTQSVVGFRIVEAGTGSPPRAPRTRIPA
jgi:DNA-binding LacI/PurR family transcriptional regulator/DNA-binding transcriptional regulator YhcF (GntR family)